ncbi:MAG: glycosyltransferase family 39 protein [Paracoccaceae bacterium]|nr:glycosyltransferase family 39 protein [Paracoccaceae bacterium]
MTKRLPAICLLAISVVWVFCFATVPAGLFTIDETIQIAGVEALARTGAFIVDNDRLAPGHEALRLWFLRPALEGTVPQYPSGFAVLAAPFWMIGGIKGIIGLNFIAAVGTAMMTGLIAQEVTGNPKTGIAAATLLMAATYLPDYAFAVWPHALAVCVSTFGIWAALRAVRAEDWRWSLMVGLALGFGGLFRVDVWFLVPALAMWAIVTSPRPIIDLALAGIGLAPGLLAASTLNWVKFGHFFPASYGQSDGGAIDASGYNFMFFVLAVAVLGCIVARLTRPVWGWFAGFAGIAVIAMLDGGFGYISASIRGAWVLGIDLRDFKGVDIDRFIYSTPTDGVIFYFTLKKALAQSMPWLGVLPVLWLIGRNAQISERRFISLLAIVAPTLLLFFASREWHGGLSSNLRYLLALAPVFAVGAVIAVSRLPSSSNWGWLSGSAAIIALSVLFLTTSDILAFKVIIEQRLPPLLFGGLALISILAVFSPVRLQPAIGALARGGFAAAIVMAVFTAFVGDVLTNFNRREIAVDRAAMVAKTPPQSLVYSGGFAGSWPVFEKPDVVLAAPNRLTGEVADDLTPLALNNGWRVFADDADVTKTILAAYPQLRADVVETTPYRAEIRQDR